MKREGNPVVDIFFEQNKMIRYALLLASWLYSYCNKTRIWWLSLFMSFLRFQRKMITDEEGIIVIQIKKLMKIKKRAEIYTSYGFQI